MKEFKTWRLSLTVAGSFLGAGYVSGQELWKFFGAFGTAALPSRVLSLVIQLLMMTMLLRLGQETRVSSLDRALFPRGGALIRNLAGAAQVVFLFGVTVIMAAGAGALVKQLFGLPAAIGGALFCLIAMLVSFMGMDGLARVCSFLVPAMILTTLAISVITLARTGFSAVLEMENVNTNPMLPNWWVAAITYVSYNVFGCIGVLTPIGPNVPDARTARLGSALGTLLLFIISAAILFAMGALPMSAEAELPMLALASDIHPALGYIYAALLICGMLGTTVSFWVATVIYLGERSPALANKRRPLTAALAVLAFGGSLLGFGDLVGTVYPAFGYLGLIAMAAISVHWLRIAREKRRAERAA